MSSFAKFMEARKADIAKEKKPSFGDTLARLNKQNVVSSSVVSSYSFSSTTASGSSSYSSMTSVSLLAKPNKAGKSVAHAFTKNNYTVGHQKVKQYLSESVRGSTASQYEKLWVRFKGFCSPFLKFGSGAH